MHATLPWSILGPHWLSTSHVHAHHVTMNRNVRKIRAMLVLCASQSAKTVWQVHVYYLSFLLGIQSSFVTIKLRGIASHLTVAKCETFHIHFDQRSHGC